MRLSSELTGLFGLVMLGGLAGFAAQPADLVAAAAVLAAAMLSLAVAVRLVLRPRPGAGQRVSVPAAALRDELRRRSVPRLRDPDARGRRRPRAPCPYPSAA